MRECWNDGMMHTIANQIVAFLALGIAPILHCIFPRVRDIRSGLLSLFQPSIIPLFHGMTVSFFPKAAYAVRSRKSAARTDAGIGAATGGAAGSRTAPQAG